MTGTLKNRLKKPEWLKWYKDIGLVIIDEAHQQDMDHLFNIEQTNGKWILGFTATPKRRGKMTQLSDNYEGMVIGIDVQELINQGYLVRDRYFGVPVDMSGVGRDSKGEYDTQEMFDRFNNTQLYQGIVLNWLTHTKDTLTLVFCVNIEHTIKTAEAFNKSGIKAEYLVSTEPSGRADKISRWKNREYNVLVNCGILTTGFNHKPIETIIIYRATTSQNLLLQMIGRGSRISEGKSYFNLLDFGENCKRLGYYRQEREYSLDHEQSRGDGVMGVKDCPKCHALLMVTSRNCKYCGYIFPLTKKEQIEVQLTEMEYKQAVKDRSVDDLEIIAKLKGYKQQWVWRQIFMTHGEEALKQYAKRKGYHHAWVKRQLTYYK